MRIKTMLALVAASAGVLTLFTAPAATAAGPSPMVGCYDGKRFWDAGVFDNGNGNNKFQIPGIDEGYDSAVGYERVYQATNRCRDINLRATVFTNYDWMHARVCYYPTAGGRWCNNWKTIYRGDSGWKVIGSDVRDGTKFVVELSYNGLMEGEIAY